jgi:hypothetical protein
MHRDRRHECLPAGVPVGLAILVVRGQYARPFEARPIRRCFEGEGFSFRVLTGLKSGVRCAAPWGEKHG